MENQNGGRQNLQNAYSQILRLAVVKSGSEATGGDFIINFWVGLEMKPTRERLKQLGVN